jgi:hypothetical protein
MYPYDGTVRDVEAGDLRPGVVLRMVNPDSTSAPFSDCVIVKLEGDMLYLKRPIAWGNGALGAEEFPVMVQSILEGGASHPYFKTVLLCNGEPYMMRT